MMKTMSDTDQVLVTKTLRLEAEQLRTRAEHAWGLGETSIYIDLITELRKVRELRFRMVQEGYTRQE